MQSKKIKITLKQKGAGKRNLLKRRLEVIKGIIHKGYFNEKG